MRKKKKCDLDVSAAIDSLDCFFSFCFQLLVLRGPGQLWGGQRVSWLERAEEHRCL